MLKLVIFKIIIFSTNTTKMYRVYPKNTSQHTLTPHRSPSPLYASTRNSNQHANTRSKIDLHKFNDYLQERISRSALKKELQMSRRELSQKKTSREPTHPEITPNPNFFKAHGLQNLKESRIKKSRQMVIPKNAWRKHESIQKLIGKQNSIALCQNRGTESESQQSALRQLERKYQELQEKYKNLMKQASENAREFERDKKELSKLKEAHLQDQSTLNKLRRQLCSLNQNMKNAQNLKPTSKDSLAKVKSEVILGMGSSSLQSAQPVHEMWKTKLFQDAKINDTLRVSRSHKTMENWNKQTDKSNIFQSEEKKRTQQSRYYSAEKAIDSMRRSNVKKNSEHSHHQNVQSKTSIKLTESIRGSRVKQPAKPVTETLIRFQNEFCKNTTPTTLHKKMLSSKPYSKYRFQPTYKME